MIQGIFTKPNASGFRGKAPMTKECMIMFGYGRVIAKHYHFCSSDPDFLTIYPQVFELARLPPLVNYEIARVLKKYRKLV